MESGEPLLAAIENNLHGHVAFVHRNTPGMTVWDTPELLLADSGLPIDNFNRICRARMDFSGVDALIDRAVGHFRFAERPFAWWVGPCSRPLNLESRLAAHGLRAAECETGMAMDLRDLAESVEGPRKLAVRRVRSDAGIEDAIAVFGGDPAIGAFYRKGAPLLLREACPMRLFVGYLDGAPVATAEVFLGSGAAGIYGVSTLERFRGQGIGSVMTWTAAGEGRREGATLAVLEASESGERVYSRLGFRACCRFWEYAPA